MNLLTFSNSFPAIAFPTVRASALASIMSSVLAFSALPAFAADLPFPHLETIGSSEISIEADMATIDIEVVVDAPTAKEAKTESDKAISQFLSRLDKAGIAKNDIDSANLNIRPQYHYQNNEPAKLVAYQASRSMTITVRDLSQLNDLLDTALDQGINRVNNIKLSSSKQAEYVERARQSAITDAKQKAASLAKGFDKKVDGVWQIRYFDQQPVQPVMYRMAAESSDANQGYQQGQVTVSDRVEVIFKLK
jgi:hypothetical protein